MQIEAENQHFTGNASDVTEIDRPAVSVRNMEKSYGSGEDTVTALSGISFDIDPGTVVGILGPNGAGKTTLIKSILDLVAPTAGKSEIFGVNVQDRPKEAYKTVAAMFEGARNTYWRLTVRQNLDFFARLDGDDPAERADRFNTLLDQLNLTRKADTRVRNLSQGQKQKTALATVLSGNKNLVFLDEPTLGLDVESSLELRRELRRLVDRTELTVVLSSHDMDVIEELCDRVIIMYKGEVVADESMANLLGVFETDVYEFTLANTIPDEIEQEIRRNFSIVSWSEETDSSEFRVALTDVNRIHDLTGTLVNDGVQLERIDVVERDFEHVFLSLTASENDGTETLPKTTLPHDGLCDVIDDV